MKQRIRCSINVLINFIVNVTKDSLQLSRK